MACSLIAMPAAVIPAPIMLSVLAVSLLQVSLPGWPGSGSAVQAGRARRLHLKCQPACRLRSCCLLWCARRRRQPPARGGVLGASRGAGLLQGSAAASWQPQHAQQAAGPAVCTGCGPKRAAPPPCCTRANAGWHRGAGPHFHDGPHSPPALPGLGLPSVARVCGSSPQAAEGSLICSGRALPAAFLVHPPSGLLSTCACQKHRALTSPAGIIQRQSIAGRATVADKEQQGGWA